MGKSMLRVLIVGATLSALTMSTVTGATASDVQASEPACLDAPAGRFLDVAGSHAATIDCIGWWGVTQGVGDDRYDPGGTVTRAQMASFLARTLSLTGFDLPATPPDAFRDDDGNPHEPAIDRLASLGVVGGVAAGRYAPSAMVTRGQMATFLANLWEARTGTPLPDASHDFSDAAGTSHEDSIGRVTGAGLTGGTSATRFGPSDPVTRAQMATFLARLLAKLVAEEHAAYPPADPVPMPSREVATNVVMGGECATRGQVGSTQSGAPTFCGTIYEDGQLLWQPQMDDVAIRAYAKLDQWFSSQTGATDTVPIHRHAEIPAEYESVMRQVLDLGSAAFAGEHGDYLALLVPPTESGREFAAEFVIDTLPEDTTEEERAAVVDAFERLFQNPCGAFSQQGRTESRPRSFIIGVFPTAGLADCLAMTPTEVGEAMAREWLGGAVQLWGNPDDSKPCWAGEASGWPMGRTVMSQARLQSTSYIWSRWTVQLVLGQPIEPYMLGLEKSESWAYEGENAYCKTGAGHIQGTLFYELLVDRYGVEGWLAWSRRSAETYTIRGAFEDVFGITLDAFSLQSDARTYRILGLD